MLEQDSEILDSSSSSDIPYKLCHFASSLALSVLPSLQRCREIRLILTLESQLLSCIISVGLHSDPVK